MRSNASTSRWRILLYTSAPHIVGDLYIPTLLIADMPKPACLCDNYFWLGGSKRWIKPLPYRDQSRLVGAFEVPLSLKGERELQSVSVWSGT